MPCFSDRFRRELDLLMRWRRDVRCFRADPVSPELLAGCLAAFASAPSVGLSEPWRVLDVRSTRARKAALENFDIANAQALSGYSGEKAKRYAHLKLSGMREAPVQLAVFCDEQTGRGAGLGAATMPETRRYSVVAAITRFWLTARAHGPGVGRVSILDPERLCRALGAPEGWRFVAYLCVGWPEEASETPEPERAGRETRRGCLIIESR